MKALKNMNGRKKKVKSEADEWRRTGGYLVRGKSH